MEVSVVDRISEVLVMESLLLLLIPLACPLIMGAMGVGAWLWAKMRSAPVNFAGTRRAEREA
jgi:hypothetical protein